MNSATHCFSFIYFNVVNFSLDLHESLCVVAIGFGTSLSKYRSTYVYVFTLQFWL